ncbi:purine nucleoside phosphorylase LACC1 isoform X4 [Syngnathus scovelli]|uniref:purine nucleoside phosphorylase LACC1 isoform X4 n=1 Tax=Syngnathus scovelli TaxID=161590 RepID=UPI002110D18E|nr:purine nucleoside phosphorylase LACC1 isoform X4 [Syngnathus scovelli]
MSESAAAVLLDLAHACRCGCTERLFREEAAAATADAHLLVLCAGSARSAVVDASVRAWSGGGGARVLLDWSATAACAYRLKRAADEAGVLWLRVITSPRGRALLLGYERALFTALYKFTYRLGCGPRPLRGADTPVRKVEGDVTVLLQALPAVGGAIRLLTSTLIPECFGHGFSTRAGGVSLVPTLSSLNLFSSPRRRDSAALVNENRRRLALHAGFYPRPLQMLKAGEERCWASPQQRCRPWRPSWAACAPTSVWSWAPRSGRAASRWSRNRPPASGRTACAVHRRTGPTWTSDWPTGGLTLAPASLLFRCSSCHQILFLLALSPFFLILFLLLPLLPVPCSLISPGWRACGRLQLEEAGIPALHIQDDPGVAPCTSCHPGDFFSHVRDGAHFGTQVGFLWLKEEAAAVGKASSGRLRD